MTHPEGVPAPFTTKASSGKNHEAYGEEFFLETTKYNPHSPYSASKQAQTTSCVLSTIHTVCQPS